MSEGSFVVLLGWLPWLAGFDMAIVGFAVGVTLIPQSTVVEFTEGCVAGLDTYKLLEACCFVAAILAIFQATASISVMVFVGEKKRIQEVASRVWCRRAVVAVVVSHAATTVCLICIVDALVFVRLATFHCLGHRRYFLVVGDALAGLLGIALTVLAS